jgi:hypothetical protein
MTIETHTSFMKHNNDDQRSAELLRYLALCKRVYERMEREGTWPWPDLDTAPQSPKSLNMIESRDNPQQL